MTAQQLLTQLATMDTAFFTGEAAISELQAIRRDAQATLVYKGEAMPDMQGDHIFHALMVGICFALFLGIGVGFSVCAWFHLC